MERKFNPFRRGEIPGIQISRIRSRRRRGGAREPRTAIRFARIGPLRGAVARACSVALTTHKNEFVVSASFAVCTPPVQHVYHSRLFDSTDREARAAAAHGDVADAGSAVTDEIQGAESPFFEIPILSFEGRVGNR